PCGYGRVLRFLVRRFPDARVTACELLPDAVRFCAATFNAIPAQSAYELDTLTLGARYDLIWCGSLATHLDARRTRELLPFFARGWDEHQDVYGFVKEDDAATPPAA